MPGEQKYQPSEGEIAEAESYLTSTDKEQSAEREREQREFEERTRQGFNDLETTLNNKKEFSTSLYKVVEELPENMRTYQILRAYHFMYQLFGGDGPLSDVKNDYLNGINVAEIAGLEGYDHDWPSRDAFEFAGANYLGTDIAVSEEDKSVTNGQVSETKKVDALNPDQSLGSKKFEVVFSLGFFGYPTDEIAKSLRTDTRTVEDRVFSEWAKYTRQGGIFIAGSRDGSIEMDIEKAEKMGYEIINIPIEFTSPNKFIIARKRGMYETAKSAEDLPVEAQDQAA